MIQRIIHTVPGNRDLIIIFLGWGSDARALSGLSYPGGDIMAVWDYRDETFDPVPLSRYRHLYLFAWSMGIMMAERTLRKYPQLHPTLCIAVNGSPRPVHDSEGIPCGIFRGTLNGLNDLTLGKFRRRMCRNAHEYADYCKVLPERSVDELRDELRILGERAAEATHVTTAIPWDRAIIAEDDRIFPPENLHRAWSGLSRVRMTEGAHLPNWQTILNQEIIDKSYVATKFRRSISTYDTEAVAQKTIAKHLWELWHKELAGRTPLSIIEAGFGTGIMTRLYVPALRPYRLMLWDLCPVDLEIPCAGEIIAGDAEELIAQLPDAYAEAVVSASTMQWFNSPATFIANASRVLSKGGHLVVSTFGERNMWELSQVTRLPLRYLTLDELTSLLPADMRLLAAMQEEIVLHFDSPREVMSHLRATGVNGMRDARTPLARILSDYPYSPDGGVTLTYHPLYLIAEKL